MGNLLLSLLFFNSITFFISAPAVHFIWSYSTDKAKGLYNYCLLKPFNPAASPASNWMYVFNPSPLILVLYYHYISGKKYLVILYMYLTAPLTCDGDCT